METAMDDKDTRLKQVKVSVGPEIAAAFKAACAASNITMTAELSRFMAAYVNGSVKRKAAPDYTTRRNRRTAIKAIVRELELIKAWEERVRDNTPDNLQGAYAYEATEGAISMLDEAIDALVEF